MEKLVRDLTLILLYLTSWQEDVAFGVARRSWKGYPFETLDVLAEEGLIDGSRRAKSVWLTEAGEEAARRLLAQYGLASRDHPEKDDRVVCLPERKRKEQPPR
ncbi:MAG: DUF6429 family protein [Thermoanaerobacteraceae bacterium]|nr:DUF6429 family protein [Thermoanaerobacteraceae bacterium]